MALRKLNTLLLELMSGITLAIPEIELAEVVDQSLSQPNEKNKPWLLGKLEWRGLEIPAIDPGVICGKQVSPLEGIHRFGILFALERIPGLGYYAVPLKAPPHPVRVGPEDLLTTTDAQELSRCEVTASMAEIEGKMVVIPDLAYIERTIQSFAPV